MTAVKAGVGRETAHEAIKRHAVAEAMSMREKGTSPQLSRRLAQDKVFREAGVTEEQINRILEDANHFAGNAREQIQEVIAKAEPLFERYAQAANYMPGEIL